MHEIQEPCLLEQDLTLGGICVTLFPPLPLVSLPSTAAWVISLPFFPPKRRTLQFPLLKPLCAAARGFGLRPGPSSCAPQMPSRNRQIGIVCSPQVPMPQAKRQVHRTVLNYEGNQPLLSQTCLTSVHASH